MLNRLYYMVDDFSLKKLAEFFGFQLHISNFIQFNDIKFGFHSAVFLIFFRT